MLKYISVVRMYVWLVGVVVRRYRFPHNITYPYSTSISPFFAEASLLLHLFLNCFFYFFIIIIIVVITHDPFLLHYLLKLVAALLLKLPKEIIVKETMIGIVIALQ